MVATVQRGLMSSSVVCEQDGAQIDPAAPRSDEFHSVGTPVGLDDVPELTQDGQCGVLDSSVEVEVAVRPGLVTGPGVDSPAVSNPWRQPASSRARSAGSTSVSPSAGSSRRPRR